MGMELGFKVGGNINFGHQQASERYFDAQTGVGMFIVHPGSGFVTHLC